MKTSQFITEEELLERAISLLLDKLGPVETKRFLSLELPKRLESVQRHRQWQAGLDEDEFYDQVFGKNK